MTDKYRFNDSLGTVDYSVDDKSNNKKDTNEIAKMILIGITIYFIFQFLTKNGTRERFGTQDIKDLLGKWKSGITGQTGQTGEENKQNQNTKNYQDEKTKKVKQLRFAATPVEFSIDDAQKEINNDLSVKQETLQQDEFIFNGEDRYPQKDMNLSNIDEGVEIDTKYSQFINLNDVKFDDINRRQLREKNQQRRLMEMILEQQSRDLVSTANCLNQERKQQENIQKNGVSVFTAFVPKTTKVQRSLKKRTQVNDKPLPKKENNYDINPLE